MTQDAGQDYNTEDLWRRLLTTGDFKRQRRERRFFRLLPAHQRCNNCFVPFDGLGSKLVGAAFDRRPSNLNPNLCTECERFARHYQGGAEIELSLLFADVRGSTSLAESMSPTAFSQLINRFYTTATNVMMQSDAMIDKIIGDQVAAMYVPGFAGGEHARRAIETARKILQATGHGRREGPWIPLDAGVHTGTAFVGSVGTREGTFDVTVLGDAPNTAARLSSVARVGEILISETAYAAAGSFLGELELKELTLEGKAQPLSVYALES